MKKGIVIGVVSVLIIIAVGLGLIIKNNQDGQLIGGCAGVSLENLQECCDNWALENNIVHIQCVGEWGIENNACSWNCS